MDQAFGWLSKNRGACLDDEYPYTAAVGSCQSTCRRVLPVTSYTTVTANSESAMMVRAPGATDTRPTGRHTACSLRLSVLWCLRVACLGSKATYMCLPELPLPANCAGTILIAISYIRASPFSCSLSPKPLILYHCNAVPVTATAARRLALVLHLLQNAIANRGAITFMMQVTDSFFNYRGGIYSESSSVCSGGGWHAMTFVGYGTDPATGRNYFKIRNSWGA